MSLLRYLRTVYDDQLSTTDYEVLNKLEDNLSKIPNTTITELSQEVYTSSTSLHRLVKKIGFSGFTEFKFEVEKHLAQQKENEYERLVNNSYLKKSLEDIRITYRLNEKKFEQIVAEMITHTDLYCFGTGWKQKQIVDNFANDLLYYGHSLKTLRNSDDLEIASKHLDENSLIFIVSLSGDMAGYEETMEYIKQKGIVTIGVSIHSDNPLTRTVKHSLNFVDSSLDLENHHWSSIPLTFIFDQLSHLFSIYKAEHEEITKKKTNLKSK